MRRLVVHAGWIFVCSLLIVCVAAIQGGIHYGLEDNSQVASAVSCRFQNVEEDGERLKLNLRCGERLAYINKRKAAVALLNDPNPFSVPLTCTLFKSGRAECTRTQ